MAQEQGKKRHIDPDPPLTPDFPRLKHPDLDPDKTKDVEELPNRDDIKLDEIKPDEQVPEPPD